MDTVSLGIYQYTGTGHKQQLVTVRQSNLLIVASTQIGVNDSAHEMIICYMIPYIVFGTSLPSKSTVNKQKRNNNGQINRNYAHKLIYPSHCCL